MNLFSGISGQGAIPVLERALSFAEQRHKVIAHNIANIDTPFYKEKDLDVREFHTALIEAIQEQKETGNSFRMSAGRHVGEDATGRIWTTPVETGRSNGIRHDQSTISVDRLMAKLAKNTSIYNGLANMLAKQYKLLRSAIRGRLS